MIRPWQPAIPQAMQRHGGRVRPAGVPAAKADKSVRENAPDESSGDANIGDANAVSAPDEPAEAKD